MEEKSIKQNVYKVVLPTKRIAILREPKIKDNQLAAKLIGNKSKNQFEMAIAMQTEFVKILLIELDGKKLDHSAKDDLDKILNLQEFNVLMKVVQKLIGGDDMGEEPEMEMAIM